MGSHPRQNYIQAFRATKVGDKASGFGNIKSKKLTLSIRVRLLGNVFGPSHIRAWRPH